MCSQQSQDEENYPVRMSDTPTPPTRPCTPRPFENRNYKHVSFSDCYKSDTIKFYKTNSTFKEVAFSSYRSTSIAIDEDDNKMESTDERSDKENNSVEIEAKPGTSKEDPMDTFVTPKFSQSLQLRGPISSTIRVRTRLFQDEPLQLGVKRSEAPVDLVEIVNVKRRKTFGKDHDPYAPSAPPEPHGLGPIFPMSEERIKELVQKSFTEELIGDFSKGFSLPLFQADKHPELKSIHPDTLAELLRGNFDNKIASYRIIDCRFPYEYNAGHIIGAENMYTREQCIGLLHDSTVSNLNEEKKNILIFHCEFSSERGPNLYRFLRREDRFKNDYPRLNFPEMYLLAGGYKLFFNKYPLMCFPEVYKEMNHPDHVADLNYFKRKVNSWNADSSRQRPQFSGLNNSDF